MARGSVMRERARTMRAEPSYLERNAGRILKDLGIAVSCQVPIGKRYILDFVGKDRPFVLEVDGSQHQEPGQSLKDIERDAFCERAGLRVIRLSVLHHQINSQTIGYWVSRIEPESRQVIRGRLALLKTLVKRGAGNTRSNLDRIGDCRANKAATTHVA